MARGCKSVRLINRRRVLLWIQLIGYMNCLNLVRGDMQTVCTTAECRDTSQQFYGHLNTTSEPCEDFYEYACGNWFKHHTIPEYADQWSTRSVMHMKTMMHLRTLLESKEKRSDDKEVVQAKKVYKLCKNMPHVRKGDLVTIKRFLQKLGTTMLFGNYQGTRSAWWYVDNYYLKISGESAFFDVNIQADAEGDKEPILHISMPTSVFGNIIRRTSWTESEANSYIMFLKTLMHALIAQPTSKLSVDMIMEDIKDLLILRSDIQEIILESEEQKSVCVRRTIGEFQKIYDKEVKLKGTHEIDWLEHARVLLGNNWGQIIVKSTPIYVCDEYYFRRLSKLLHVQPERTLVNHIHLYFVERHLILDNKLKTLLKGAVTGRSTPSGELRGDPERWYYCIQSHNMISVLGKMYVRSYFTPTITKSMKTEVERIADELKNVITLQISEARWIEKTLRTGTKNKVQQTQIIFGYPEWYETGKLKSTFDWPVQPLEVNAYNILQRNAIIINPAIMQPPIFSSSLAYATEYGTIGFTLGHELYHGLTNNGLHYNSRGVKRVWWPNSMLNVYEAKERCFIEQYSKYRVIELDQHLGEIYNNGERTVVENVADTMGLKAAYIAFRKKLEKMEGECPILPHFTKSSCEQLFFISFANTFCATMRPYALLKYVQENHHSTPRARVNGAVANMPEFSRAFRCSVNSRLKPAKRCDIWH